MAGSANAIASGPGGSFEVMTRPNPLLVDLVHARRQASARLNREWVLHDVTCRTRWLRQTVRVGGSGRAARGGGVGSAVGVTWIVLGRGGFAGLLLAVLYSLAYIDQTAERRLVKHGYEPETVKRSAAMSAIEREHADQIVRYMQTYRKAGRVEDLTLPVGGDRTFRWPCTSASRNSDRSSAVSGFDPP